MADPHQDAVLAYFRRSREAIEQAAANPDFVVATIAAAERIAHSLKNGGKAMFCGNGGSAADAQHIAAEFVGRFVRDRAPLAAIALTTDTSILTAVGNDYGFERVFERQVIALGKPGDVLVGISTSGQSPNVLAALKAARERGLVTIGFTGANGASLRALCDVTLIVPSDETALVQQVHITAGHAICALVERDVVG